MTKETMGDVVPPVHSFHVPTKPGAPEVCYLALLAFRSTFADDEDEALVCEKWNEWEEDRTKALRTARLIFDALGGNGSVLSALASRPAPSEASGDVVQAAKRVLEWWPEGSERNSHAARQKGDGFARDIQALRTALSTTPAPQADALRDESRDLAEVEPHEPTPEAVLAFIAAIANISLQAPSGVNSHKYHAARLREIRNAARHVLAKQYDELQQAIAAMIGEGRLVFDGTALQSATAPQADALREAVQIIRDWLDYGGERGLYDSGKYLDAKIRAAAFLSAQDRTLTESQTDAD